MNLTATHQSAAQLARTIGAHAKEIKAAIHKHVDGLSRDDNSYCVGKAVISIASSLDYAMFELVNAMPRE